MKEERRLTSWLADYRDSLDEMATPARVEAMLRAEVRQRRRVPVAPWLLVSGAAAVLLLGIWIGRTRVVSEPSAKVQQRMLPAPTLVELEPAEIPAAVNLPAARPRMTPAAPRRPGLAPAAPRPNAVFVMLPGSDLMPPAQDFQILRVRIPRTRIQALGWPVNVDRLEERVLADVMVGDDGVARAIRLVQADQ